MGRVQPREHCGQGAGGAFHIGRGVPPVGVVGPWAQQSPSCSWSWSAVSSSTGTSGTEAPRSRICTLPPRASFNLGRYGSRFLPEASTRLACPAGGNILRRGFKTVQVAVGAQQVRHLHAAAANGAGHVSQNGVQSRDFQYWGILGLKRTEQAQKTQKRNQHAPEHVPHDEPSLQVMQWSNLSSKAG